MKSVCAHVSLYVFIVTAVISPAALAVEWQGEYGVALEAARSSKKPLLVVMEIPSDRISEKHASGDLSSSAVLKPYELCRIDVTTEAGQKVAEAFGARQFPYTVITDKDGKNIIHRKAGQYSKLDWVSMLMTYRDGQKPSPPANEVIFSAQATPAVCFT